MNHEEVYMTGKKYRVFDGLLGKWKRFSYWNKAVDTECDDGDTVETKIGDIKGITTSASITENGYVQDAKTTQAQINTINESLTSVTSIGNLQDSTAKTVSVGNNTNTNVDTVALAPKSRYLVIGRVSFPLNTTGSRAVRILYNGSNYNTVEVGANPSSGTAVLTEAIIDNTSDSALSVAVVAYQSSKNTLSVSGDVKAVLLKAL